MHNPSKLMKILLLFMEKITWVIMTPDRESKFHAPSLHLAAHNYAPCSQQTLQQNQLNVMKPDVATYK